MGHHVDPRHSHRSDDRGDGGATTTVTGGPGEGATADPVALGALAASGVATMATTDVGAHQVRHRSTRLRRLAGVLAVIASLLVLRDLFAPGASLPSPSVPASFHPYLLPFALILLLSAVMIVPLLAAGRSPHILFRPD